MLPTSNPVRPSRGRGRGRQQETGYPKTMTPRVNHGYDKKDRNGNNLGLTAACEEMCPRSEYVLRSRERLLHCLEQGGDSRPVKEFSRPAAGQKEPSPDMIRTPAALERTVKHLLTVTLKRKDQPVDIVYNFVFDRLRAVRQDCVLQNLKDITTINILTQCVRFHVVFGFLLSSLSIARFDPTINFAHQLECLKSCLLLHHQLQMDVNTREEMSHIYLLSNMGSQAPLVWATQQDKLLRTRLRTSLDLSKSYQERNYVRFFRIVHSLPTIHLLAVYKFLSAVSVQSLAVMSSGYSSVNCRFPLVKVHQLLMLDETKVVDLVSRHGLKLEGGAVRFKRDEFRGGGEEGQDWYYDWVSDRLKRANVTDLVMMGQRGEDCGRVERKLRDVELRDYWEG